MNLIRYFLSFFPFTIHAALDIYGFAIRDFDVSNIFKGT